MSRLLLSLLLATTLLPANPNAVAQNAEPASVSATRSKIVDDAGLFSRSAVEKARISLAETEALSGASVVIETVPSLKGEGIEEATTRAAKASTDADLFFLIAKAERRISQPVVKDGAKITATQGQRVREAILKGFQAGQFDEGLTEGVGRLSAMLRNPSAEQAQTREDLIIRGRVQLTLAGARKILDAAEAKAAEMDLKSNIAVVDDGGHLLAFIRMDGARPASAVTAQTKAISAATFRQATGPLPNATNPDLLLSLSVPAAALAGGPRITPLLGGIPIEVDGQVIGAIGVGGGTGQQDAEVARAGLSAFLGAIERSSQEPKTPDPKGSGANP